MRKNHTATGGDVPLASTYNDKVIQKVSDLWLIAQRLADELQKLAASESQAARNIEAMIRCVQAGESWQDAMDRNTDGAHHE